MDKDMKLSKDVIYIVIMIGLVLAGYFFLYQPLQEYDDYDIENTKKEERIKQLEIELNEKDSLYNITKQERDNALFAIKHRKDNIKVIVEKYDKEIVNISSLNATESVKYFSSWINE